MLDVRGKPLAVGDRVVYSTGRYANLYVGYVVGFTPKRIKVGSSMLSAGIVKSSDQIAKVE